MKSYSQLPYLDAFAKLREEVGKLDIFGRKDVLRRFISFSTNLQFFLPAIPYESHEQLFKKLCLQQHLSHLDQNHPQALRYVAPGTLDVLHAEVLKPTAGIICTYHTGSYRLINKMLMQQGVPFSLLVAGDVLAEEQADYLRIFRETAAEQNGGCFHLINAQHPKALLQLLGDLKRGRKLVVYLDGNSGTGNTLTVKNACAVHFFDKCLRVRKGVATLAYLAKCPIFPLICKRTNNAQIDFDVHPTIHPQLAASRAEFEQQTVQRLYKYLQVYTRVSPGDWEGWLHIHRYLVEGNSIGRGNDISHLKIW
ncbi:MULTISPECIES: LpxL/LpxP family acyltransferase [Olivibacter]|uniref:KDO2-lipid IV(A) lauroyltransferase n=1 Tax=Olivibacter jilunii TaxID=985016 RepID=A0ABW6B6S1_9SPHI